MNIKEIKELIALLSDTDVADFALHRPDGTRVRIRRGGRGRYVEIESHSGSRAAAASLAANGIEEARAVEAPGRLVTSPFVGTFYRAPNPDASPYVELGHHVKKGQVLCIVEAMKIMNEIEADLDGRVAEILAENGQAVEFGQPLFRIEPI